MKCSKCGFVSFDYLGECKKCGANLAVVSEGLGVVETRKSMPFMLGSLLKDYVKPAEAQEDGVSAAGPLPAIDLHAEIEEPPVMRAAAPVASAPAEEELDVDFSKEEIELLMQHEEGAASEPAAKTAPKPVAVAAAPAVDDALEELDLDFDDAMLEEPKPVAAKPVAPAPAPPAASAQPVSEDLDLVLSETDMEDLLSDIGEPSGKKKPPPESGK